ncbi:Rv3235 family protein [Nocardia seriolae]|uniref:Rv3235 family protein n=1 Tax=Nocardia seriolae TaxID=37332 RepID=UPI0011601CDD|nr:Rv3235 family protein [Nocardia seriolae]WNJ58050.1 Rv3235 family protein [Nocardia seriolae]
MASEGGFLLPVTPFEPPVEPCPPRPRAAGSELDPRPVACRNRVDRKSVSRSAGSVGLRRVLRSSHAVKTRDSDEYNTAARQFAGRALRSALEVLDGRRPPGQLSPFAEPAVVAAVRTLAGAGRLPGRELGSATLTRVDVIMSEPGRAEVCAGYDRGPRHFALAARIVRGRSGWRLAAFRVC